MPSWLNHKIMGNSRIHVATTYQVKYEFGDFSNKSEFINQLIAENCPSATFNEDDHLYADSIEVPRAELAMLAGKIAKEREKYEPIFAQELNYTVDNVIFAISSWIAYSDQRNDYVVLQWF